MIGLLVRVAIFEISFASLERGLAQTEFPADELRKLQDLFQREIDEPRLLRAMRGERAISTDMIEATRDGRLAPSNMVGALNGWQALVPRWLPMPVSHDRATHLRTMNAIVEASKEPVEKQLDAIDEAVNKWQGRDWLADGILRGCTKTTMAHIRGQARTRC